MCRKIVLFSVLFILLTSISVTSASVSYFEISPENPVKGDIVKIEGKASPSEQVPITLSFEEDLNVVEGKYEWKLSSVEIPKGENRFTVTATNVNNLNVALKIFFWITKSADAENGIVEISQSNVPAGTHDAKISGKSDSNEVNIKVEAEAFLTADDASGKFEYTYDTSSIPLGEFEVNVGGISKTVELLETRTTPTTGGGGGSGPSYTTTIPTPTPTPTSTTIENVTSNETVISTPTPTPTLTPTMAQTPTPTPSPTPSPTPKPWIPGFEAVFTIAGLLAAVAYLVLRRKK